MKQTLITLVCLIGISFTLRSQEAYLDKITTQKRHTTPGGSVDTCLSKNGKKTYVYWQNLILGNEPDLAKYKAFISFWKVSNPKKKWECWEDIYYSDALILINPNHAGIWSEGQKEEYEFEITFWVQQSDTVASVKTLRLDQRIEIPKSFKFPLLF